MKLRELFTHDDNETLCEIRVLGAMGVIAVVTGGFLALPVLEIGGGVAAILIALGGAMKLRGSS